MFENIIEQGAVLQLRDNIINCSLAPSLLFFGPGESGKGSAALELARVLSCEEKGAWKCSCLCCERHRYLQHDDLLILGNRSFSAEIAACHSSFLRNTGAKLLFYRSLRKLQMRFSPVIMEDDNDLRKLVSLLQSFDEKLREFLSIDAEKHEKSALEKLCSSLVNDSLTLIKEGKLSGTIPIDHIRSASKWCNLAPTGKRKTFIIENAENMREESANSLLKLLEEPPASVNIVLTAQRREKILATILSRLRPYRFLKRSIESEKEVIRRIFLDTADKSLSAYLESFMPQSAEKLYPLAAWFIVSIARLAGAGKICFSKLEEYYAHSAEALKLPRAARSSDVIKVIAEQSENFEDGSFSRFMKICLDMIGSFLRTAENPQFIVYCDMFKKYINEAVMAVDVININKTVALEEFLYNLKKNIKEGKNG
ncbi:MAG: DNA polymerase III [Treponema sp.]|nr:DNA polymerase III [Treponema sp.]